MGSAGQENPIVDERAQSQCHVTHVQGRIQSQVARDRVLRLAAHAVVEEELSERAAHAEAQIEDPEPPLFVHFRCAALTGPARL